MKIIFIFLLITLTTCKEISPFIVGEAATEGEFPFVVAIRINQQTECVGILVREDFVLTTKDCIRGNNFAYHAIAGVTDLSNNDDPNRQVLFVEGIFPYDLSPDFRVTLLQLEENFTLTDTVKLINLTNVPEEITSGLVAGWGSNSASFPGFDGSVSILHKTEEISIFDNETCQNKFPGYPFFDIPKFEADVNFCAANENSGPCPVDAGGPFLVGENYNSLYGIYERGERQLNYLNICAVNGRAGMYIRVEPIIPWIEDVLRKNPPPVPTTTESLQTTSSTDEITTILTTEFLSTTETEVDATTKEPLFPTITTSSDPTSTSDASTDKPEISTEVTTDSPTTLPTQATASTESSTSEESSGDPLISTTLGSTTSSTPSPPVSPTNAPVADAEEDARNGIIIIFLVIISTMTCIVNCTVFGIVLYQRFKIRTFVRKKISKYSRESEA